MEKIQYINAINQSNLNPENLVCEDCSGWLIPPLYLKQNGSNICGQCFSRRKENKNETFRNKALEMLVDTVNYPCRYDSCDFLGQATKMIEHVKQCPYGPVNCIFCKAKDLHEENIIQHLLEKHSDRIQQESADEPIATIEMKTSIQNGGFYLYNIRGNIFVVNVENHNNSLSLSIGRQFIRNSTICDKFVIIFSDDNNEFRTKGTILNVRDVFESNASKIDFPYLQEVNMKIQIYFSDYEMVGGMCLADCPVCLKQLSSDLYLCKRGHGVCARCKTKTCPYCAENYYSAMTIVKYILPNVYFPCENADAGCLQHANHSELVDHQPLCPYRLVKCEICAEPHTKQTIIQHMANKHALFGNTVSMDTDMNVLPQHLYLRNGNNLFRIVFAEGKEASMKLSLSAQLLYCHSDNVAQKYRYAVHIMDANDSNRVFYKFGGSCQAMGNDNADANIKLNDIRKYLQPDGEKELIHYWCCVYNAI